MDCHKLCEDMFSAPPDYYDTEREIMRILRVVSDLYPAVVGGLGIHAHEMSRLQADKGHEVTVVTYKNRVHNWSLCHAHNYSLIQVTPSFVLFGNSISLSLPSVISSQVKKFDVVHAHSHLFYSTVIAALVCRHRKTPLVITNHGLISQTAPMWLQQIYLPTIGRWIYNTADRIISYTETEKEKLIHLGIEGKKIMIIHNGICTETFSPSATLPEKQILWVGRYTPGKGVEYLIEAFRLFHERYPDYVLLLVGKGPEKDKIIRKIQKYGLASSIHLVDFIPNEDIPSLYRKSSIFVLPSLEEGVPRTILEAMACGVPVVCTDLPQLVDIVKGSGILVPVRDSQKLAEAFMRIVADRDQARQFGVNGRDRVVSDFSWEDTVRRTLELYKEVIESSDGGKGV